MNLIKKVVLSAAFCSIIYLLARCDSTEPPIEAHGLVLELKDVSCTEAWIELSTINLQIPATVILKQNNQTRATINLVNPDTLLYIDSLLPNQSYSFQSFIQPINQSEVKSNELNVTTMDTTSHNFTFETFTFGDISNNVLFDVAVITEDNIWCVGEINIADTSINGYTTYNAVHWDGNEWILKRIKTNACGGVDYPPVKAIFAFSSTDILFAHIDGSISHYDGIKFTNDCSLITQLNGSVNKMWGKSKNDFYVVSGNGFIAHYQNWQWSRITSGTDVDLLDVWGTSDGKIVWVSGINLNKTVLIKIENNQVKTVFEDQYPWQIQEGRISGGISSIWTNSKNFIYLTTPITAYRCLSTTSGEGKEIYPFDDYLNGGTIRIRGNAGNDIITSGSNCSILHYNGFSWKRYEQFTDINTYLWSSDIRGNTMVAVGDKLENLFYYKAIVIVGKK